MLDVHDMFPNTGINEMRFLSWVINAWPVVGVSEGDSVG